MNKRLFHRVNGVFLSLFVALHMITHLSGLWGIESYNATQKAMRLLYRNEVVEPILLLSIVVQIILGVMLLARGFKRKMAETWARRQALSGIVVLAFLSQHLVAMAFARWGAGLDTSFYWPASVMQGPPFYWYFAPYYFLGVTAVFVHLGCWLRLYLLRQNQRHMAGSAFWILSVSGACLATLSVAMLLGVFYDIELPQEWRIYLNTFIPAPGQ